MRSGTSCFDWTVFKKTICRFWPLWAAYFVLWLIILPLQGLMLLRMDSYPDGYGRYMEDFAFERVAGAAGGTCLTLAVAFGALAAMAALSHLYNARSANLFGSLPIRREGLFAAHYLAGLCFLLVPNGVIFLLTLLVELAGGAVSMQGLGFWLAVICGEGFFFYSLAVFCGLFTGHLLALPAFYTIVNGLAAGLLVLVSFVFRTFYYGFNGFSYRVDSAAEWLTPAARLGRAVQSSAQWLPDSVTGSALSGGRWTLETQGLGTVGIYAAAALALTAGAFFLYRARHMESAGDVVSVKPMRPVFKYGVAFCAGLAFGLGTMAVTGGGKVTLMAAIAAWGVAGCFAAQMMLDKSFKVFRKWKGAAAVAGVFLALFAVVGFDLTGYETRVPNPGDVARVEVSGLRGADLSDGGDWVDLTVDDPEVIGLLTGLHRAAAEQGDRYVPGVHTTLRLTYTLNNGATLRRWYSFRVDPGQVGQEGSGAWALERLYRNRELYWRAYGFDRLEEEIANGFRLDSAEYTRYDEEQGYHTSGIVGYGGDARALLDAVEEDFRAGRIGARTLTREEGGGQYGTLTFRVNSPSGEGIVFWLEIAVQDTASSTLKWLAEHPAQEEAPDPARTRTLD